VSGSSGGSEGQLWPQRCSPPKIALLESPSPMATESNLTGFRWLAEDNRASE
jgi:hypothetical protein